MCVREGVRKEGGGVKECRKVMVRKDRSAFRKWEKEGLEREGRRRRGRQEGR